MTDQMDLQATWKTKLPIAIPRGKLRLFMYIHMIMMSTRGFEPFSTFMTPKYSLMKISMMVFPVPHHTKSMCT